MCLVRRHRAGGFDSAMQLVILAACRHPMPRSLLPPLSRRLSRRW